jgi:hypothetical protein
MAQVIETLPNNCETLSSNKPQFFQKKKGFTILTKDLCNILRNKNDSQKSKSAL